ncbi:DnaA regulatory inactivator Hda [Salinicola endophyticus]|uniref:DnaA regulatory inactivator Hda n=1 Tax=Salinicola endophyticus TaxID=1949083 RepID=A0ABY8FNB9_9GAMM|nr:DnaA regulatory inactivator Hda [Salinicola endophyticus]WFF43163.1 DnaA regulatory inactivator Hda [Salinicola endophyticus]
MRPGPSQLPLGVGLRDDATFANYFPGDNAPLVAHLASQRESAGEPFLYLWGGSGVGCSHLLQAACHAADAGGQRALYLPLDALGHFPPDILEEPERLDLLAIDDLQLVVGRKRWEEALFHGFNRLRDAGKRLVIAADRSPRQLDIKLPDLASRMTWGMVFHVQPLNDAQRLGALQLRARVRGMQLPDEVARYILHRGPRQLDQLSEILARLDRASLSAKRKLTIPFVKQALEW